MKRILVFLVTCAFLFVWYSAKSQIAVYDAQYLANIDVSLIDEMLGTTSTGVPIINDNNQEIRRAQFLELTGLEKNELENLKEFINEPFSKNVKPFNHELIQEILKRNQLYFLSARTNMETVRGFSSGMLSSFGVISSIFSGNASLTDSVQSNLIDGLTKYYAEEFRRAQTITYMKAFEATAGKIGELQILFPETLQKLKNADPSKFPDLGNEYKEIFNSDLKNLWINLTSYIENYPKGALPDFRLTLLKAKNLSFIKNHDLYYPTKSTAEVLERLIKGQHPVEIINFLDGQYYDSISLNKPSIKRSIEDKLSITLHGLNLFQANLRDTSKVNGRIWVSQEVIRGLNTDKELEYFIALLYQQDRNYFDKLLGINEKWSPDMGEIKKFVKSQVIPFLDQLDQIQTLKNTLEQTEDKSKIFLEYMEANIMLLADKGLIKESLSEYFVLGKDMINLYNDIRESDFSNSIYHVLNMASKMTEDSEVDISEALFKMEEYGGFMSEVVNAENSEEIKETIKKFAAPPASFILKRTHRFTISVTGQPGYFTSIEQLVGKREWKFVSGLTLPMGFEFSLKKKSDPIRTKPSFGLFLQLIDLGAVLNFRLDDSTSELPDLVTFEQVFSPGASLTYGLKNSPVTLGLGYQYSPELRKIDIGLPSEILLNGNRVILRVGWDIPLLNLHKSKAR